MPSFLFLHGAGHTSKVWDKILPLLTQRGYEVAAPQLPSSGGDPPVKDYQPDIDVIRRSTTQLLEKGNDVVIVAHSYAGIPVGTALEGFDKQARSDAGESHSVVRLIWLDAFVVPERYQWTEDGAQPNFGPGFTVDLAKGVVTVDPEDAKKMFYVDLSQEDADKLAAELQPQSIGPCWAKTTSAAWRTIPTTVILCTKSHAVPIFKGLVEAAMALGNHKIDNVIDLEGGHTPMYSQPDNLVEILDRETKR